MPMRATTKRAGLGERIAVIALVMMCLLSAILAQTAYAAGNPLTLTVGQVFTSSSASAEDTFTYKLQPLAGSQMSGGSSVDYTFTIDGTASVTVGPLTYDRPGVYRYEVLQVIGVEKPGYTYDKRVYTLEVHVDEKLNVEIVVYKQDGTKASTKASAIAFENSYKALPSDPKLMVDPPVKKTVSGSPSKDSTFTFKLTARDATQPMPTGSVNGVKTVMVVGAGEGEFGTWSYDKAGVYYYTISEVNAGETGYTYDTVVYTITDTVKEENGRLTLTRVVTNDANKRVTTLGFINKYSGSGGNGGSGSGPKTGDDSNATLYIILLVLGGALAIGAAIYLIASGKRKKASLSA